MVGNIPNFTKIDVLRCFLRFDRNASRQDLAKELELGEGTTRTILNSLKTKKLLDSTKKGHYLSKNGEQELKHILGYISTPKAIITEQLYPDFKKSGVAVKDAKNLRELYKLRDIAVKNGADGAILLKFDGRLYAPESDYSQDYNEFEKYFKLEKNDAVVIAFSNEKRSAENGALAIAVELNVMLKKFVNEF
ncbi:hypothetical protein HYW20_02850 [Candidatus Woesearchaeota archaeon]|nr:hypothetical protein [Candidatus Woesearchaeota archaeon]